MKHYLIKTIDGETTRLEGTSWRTGDDGRLVIRNEKQEVITIYAPGKWISLKEETK